MKARSLLLSALFAIARVAGATPEIDQGQTILDPTTVHALGGASEQKLAQIVTAGFTGALEEVRLPVSCSSGELRVEIQGVTGGKPDGTTLSFEIIPGASLGAASPDFRSLPLSDPVALTAGRLFSIVLSTTGSCQVFRGPVGDPYPGGNAFYGARPNAPGWVPLPERLDLPFQTLVEVNALASLFGSVSLRLGPQESDDSFLVRIFFEPTGDVEDFDLDADALSFQMGPLARTIAPGSFSDRLRGLYRFEGTSEGVELKAILLLREGLCYLRVEGSKANLGGIGLPIPLRMTLGDKSGHTLLTTLSAGDSRGRNSRRVSF